MLGWCCISKCFGRFLIIIVFLFFCSSLATAVPVAHFTYTINGSSITCTSTSTGATCYSWNISVDGVGSGDTGWICDNSSKIFIYTVQRTCQIQITHGAKNSTTSDFTTMGLGYITVAVDHPTYQNSTNRALCEDNGYYWYQDTDGVSRCHKDPETLPWNERKAPPQAGYPSFPSIRFGYFKLTLDGIIFFVIVIFIFLYVLSKMREKGGTNNGGNIIIIRK